MTYSVKTHTVAKNHIYFGNALDYIGNIFYVKDIPTPFSRNFSVQSECHTCFPFLVMFLSFCRQIMQGEHPAVTCK